MSVAHTEERFLDEKEFAGRYGISSQTARIWRITGKGPCHCKIGRLVRYRLSDLLAWEETLTRNSTSEMEVSNA